MNTWHPWLALFVLMMSTVPVMSQENGALTTPDATASFDQRYEAARALANAGERDAAISAYSALLSQSPGNVDVLLGRGLVHARAGSWNKSESDLLTAIEKSPAYADLWSALGDMYAWSDRPVAAVDAYSHLIELRPADPAAYTARALSYRAAGDLELARMDFLTAKSLGAAPERIDTYLAGLVPRTSSPDAIAPLGYRWSAGLSSSLSDFTPARAHWRDDTLSVRHYFEKGSLALELLNAHRFNKSDDAFAVDGYAPLWDRAYTNLRYQLTTHASLYPHNSWRAELFQGVGTGWELSVSHDQLAFGGTPVRMYGLGVGKYIGNFYVRVRHLIIPGDNGKSVSDRLLCRYYYSGDADNYFELNAGSGRNDDPLVIANGKENHSSVGAVFVRYPSTQWGYKIGFDYAKESNSFRERDYSLALYRRW